MRALQAADQAAIHLLVESLRKEETVAISAGGWSMFPVIFPGDSIQIQMCAAQKLKVGDTVLINRQNYLILHRIYCIIHEGLEGKTLFKTKGDCKFWSDGEIQAKEIVAKVILCGAGIPRQILWRISDSTMKLINLFWVSPFGKFLYRRAVMIKRRLFQ